MVENDQRLGEVTTHRHVDRGPLETRDLESVEVDQVVGPDGPGVHHPQTVPEPAHLSHFGEVHDPAFRVKQRERVHRRSRVMAQCRRVLITGRRRHRNGSESIDPLPGLLR